MATAKVGMEIERRRIMKEIERLIDHHCPYRPITESPESIEVRRVLGELYDFVSCVNSVVEEEP